MLKSEEGWIFHNHAFYLLHEIINKMYDVTFLETMLDVGAGPGIASAIIKIMFPHINQTLLEVDKKNLSKWKMRNLRGQIYNGKNIPFEKESFDIVLCSHVLEHVKKPEKFIKELWRVTKNRLIIAVPDGDYNIKEHRFIFNRSNFIDMISNSIGYKNNIKKVYPVYHSHINNLMAVIDRT